MAGNALLCLYMNIGHQAFKKSARETPRRRPPHGYSCLKENNIKLARDHSILFLL